MTVRELTGAMWYTQKLRLVTSVDDYFASVDERTLFYRENMALLSDANKKYLDREVKSFGVIDGDVVVVVK